MKRWYSLFLKILLILAVTGCNLASSVTVRETSSTNSTNSVLFQDDFSNPSSGWLQGKDEFGAAEYTNGGFRIYVSADVSGKLSVPRLHFTDVRVEVDATKVGGPDDNDFGIVCRLVDENNFYFFEISSDGYYGVGKYKDNQLALIGMDQMQSSDVIQQGTGFNHLRADCVGSTLTLFINRVKVAEVQDTDFAAGDVGLIAGSFETPGVEILFDNFTVLKP